METLELLKTHGYSLEWNFTTFTLYEDEVRDYAEKLPVEKQEAFLEAMFGEGYPGQVEEPFVVELIQDVRPGDALELMWLCSQRMVGVYRVTEDYTLHQCCDVEEYGSLFLPDISTTFKTETVDNNMDLFDESYEVNDFRCVFLHELDPDSVETTSYCDRLDFYEEEYKHMFKKVIYVIARTKMAGLNGEPVRIVLPFDAEGHAEFMECMRKVDDPCHSYAAFTNETCLLTWMYTFDV